jgi:hypothetical protein
MRCPDGCVPSTDPRRAGSCVVCARLLGPHVLTEQFVRDYYRSIGAPNAVDEGLRRLRVGAQQYGWTDYLDKDNPQEAIEELLDAIHYAIFCTLTSRLDGDPERAAQRVEHAHSAAQKVVAAMQDFQAIRELER